MICGKLHRIKASCSGLGSLRDRGRMCTLGSRHITIHFLSSRLMSFPLRRPNVQTDVQMGDCLFGLFSANKTESI